MKATKVFYDGQCKVCSGEKAYYSHLQADRPVEWIDIHSTPFEKFEAEIPFHEAMKKIHLKKPSGEIVKGVDVFIEIWKMYPQYQLLSLALSLPVVHSFAEMGYKVFSRNRHFFGRFLRRHKHCDDGSCDL